MKIYFSSLALAGLLLLSSCGSQKDLNKVSAKSDFPESKFGWKLGAQSYTFKAYTFFEAIDKIDSCGLKYVEAFPTQIIGGGVEGKMDFKMDEISRNLILKKLQEKGVKMYGFGVIKANNDADWRKLFEFAKAMGVETITSEPDEKDLPLLSKLCDEFKINIAIHNHPKPSYYWNPDVVLNALKGQSKRIGACADIGHWVRLGLDPVECLRKLEGHDFQMHMKDLNEKGVLTAHDVHWGTGVSDILGVIQELKRQNFSGMISAEYEYNWDNNVSDVVASIAYFRKILRK